MAKPLIHAKHDVKHWGGSVEDYLPIHDFMDSSKAHVADSRHRAILHTSFGCYIAERVFGTFITNTSGKQVSVRDIAENHILLDFKGRFIPTVQDYVEHMEMKDWMVNAMAGTPSSYKKLENKKNAKESKVD